MNIKDLIQQYKDLGYLESDAEAKVCQDIVLYSISNSPFNRNITIKSGVVMHNLSHNLRRATVDIDLDFINYSSEDSSIRNFVETLNENKEFKIKVVSNIEKLHHQDYDGKRVYIEIGDDFGNCLTTKLDIGVHKDFNIIQEEYCFDLNVIDNSVPLFINSFEQIFTEKLKSLLKFGITSTRYKDIFDFYYLISENKLNESKLIKCIHILILENNEFKETDLNALRRRITFIFNNKPYLKRLEGSKKNWLEIPTNVVVNEILEYVDSLGAVVV